jgi:hypothetical protein
MATQNLPATTTINRLCVVAVLTLGILMLWAILANLVWIVLNYVSRTEAAEQLFVNARGTVLFASRSEFTPSRLTYRDLDGKPVEAVSEQELLEPASLPIPSQHNESFSTSNWRDRMESVSDRENSSYWYLVHNGESVAGRARLEGFDQLSFRPLGFIGTGGFSTHPPPENEEFKIDIRQIGLHRGGTANFTDYAGSVPIYRRQPLETQGHVYLLNGSDVFDVDLTRRSLVPLLPGERILAIDVGLIGSQATSAGTNNRPSASLRKGGPDRREPRRRLFLRTETQIIVIKPGEDEECRYTIPPAIAGSNFDCYALGADRALLITHGNTQGDSSSTALWINGSGQETEIKTIPLSVAEKKADYLSSNWSTAIIWPAPLLNAIYLRVAPPLPPKLNEPLRRELAVGQPYSAAWPPFLALSFVSAVGSCILMWLARRETASVKLAWALATFLLGPFGAFVCWAQFVRPNSRTLAVSPDFHSSSIDILEMQ